ncbi:uveal autoantigen with coiled-coil domains and ankyrin repeats-like [Xenia sp. Carnegie-2017]|uniref:uveal autoantigen with coiled-coil domains and ankyrin repeats-like n=1 Tax=Xenia sp. Carnegie-2017 TaxID=2897299 RepID=UPI001F0346B6|nr:uveal autoantigen with coiled-coil domains and ankyrin repeats-like [Xenia sp. Carnegie-2017]
MRLLLIEELRLCVTAMKKFKDKLAKGSSGHVSMIEWNKHDDKMLDYTVNGDENKLRLALGRKGVSPLKKKSDGKTLLDVACELGNVSCLDVLLERCADIVSVSKAGSSALHTAAKTGHAQCLAKLLQHKVRVGSQDQERMTALHHSASKGHSDCVTVLITSGAKLNIRDKDGRTPLLIAIQAAREMIVKMLVENGAKVNLTDSSQKTPLMYASLIGLKESVGLLLQNGANPLLRDTNGHIAEDFARISGYSEIVDMISSAPVLLQWSMADEYIDDEDIPSQDGSIIGSNDGSDVASVMSRPDSDHCRESVYSSDRISSSHSVSTSVSSPSTQATRRKVNVNRMQELEMENSRLNVQLRSLQMEQSVEGKVDRLSLEDINHNETNQDELANDEPVRIEILRKSLDALRVENERLRNEKNDINVDDSIPTIPITVYQQLKESSEEVLNTLNGNVTNLKKENERLRRQISEMKRQTTNELLGKAEQKIHALEEQVFRLQNQLVEADNEHSKTINMYRLHLLNAVQGNMNSDVKNALELILRIRYDEQFC